MRKLVFAIALAAGGFACTAGQAQIVPNIGTVIAMGSKFCPVGWLPADGKTVPIFEHEQLFYVIGTKYGGDGHNTFGVPNLKGGTFGPRQPRLTWCIAAVGRMPMAPKQK